MTSRIFHFALQSTLEIPSSFSDKAGNCPVIALKLLIIFCIFRKVVLFQYLTFETLLFEPPSPPAVSPPPQFCCIFLRLSPAEYTF